MAKTDKLNWKTDNKKYYNAATNTKKNQLINKSSHYAQNTQNPSKKTACPIAVNATGNPWETSGAMPATVPLPNDVIITNKWV